MLAKLMLSVAMAGAVACGSSSGSRQGKEQPAEAQVNQREQLVVGAPTFEPVSDPASAAQEAGASQEAKARQENSSNLKPTQTVKQGLKGKVNVRQGNFMPSPDAPRQTGESGVQREVYIYELTNMSQVQGQAPFYAAIQTKQVAKVVSDENGAFAVELKPGKYSVFVKEAQGFFANLFDGQNNIFPVEVKANQVTEVDFVIDHQATY